MGKSLEILVHADWSEQLSCDHALAPPTLELLQHMILVCHMLYVTTGFFQNIPT